MRLSLFQDILMRLTVPPNTYTTWFIGLQSNRRECLQIVHRFYFDLDRE